MATRACKRKLGNTLRGQDGYDFLRSCWLVYLPWNCFERLNGEEPVKQESVKEKFAGYEMIAKIRGRQQEMLSRYH